MRDVLINFIDCDKDVISETHCSIEFVLSMEKDDFKLLKPIFKENNATFEDILRRIMYLGLNPITDIDYGYVNVGGNIMNIYDFKINSYSMDGNRAYLILVSHEEIESKEIVKDESGHSYCDIKLKRAIIPKFFGEKEHGIFLSVKGEK